MMTAQVNARCPAFDHSLSSHRAMHHPLQCALRSSSARLLARVAHSITRGDGVGATHGCLGHGVVQLADSRPSASAGGRRPAGAAGYAQTAVHVVGGVGAAPPGRPGLGHVLQRLRRCLPRRRGDPDLGLHGANGVAAQGFRGPAPGALLQPVPPDPDAAGQRGIHRPVRRRHQRPAPATTTIASMARVSASPSWSAARPTGNRGEAPADHGPAPRAGSCWARPPRSAGSAPSWRWCTCPRHRGPACPVSCRPSPAI